ncbi:hypothetical protein LINPERHAP2_LOCUS21169, partial [Linum perenne]
MAYLVEASAVQSTYPTLQEFEATEEANRGMGVIPMCDCCLPAKVYKVYPKFAGSPTPYQYFLGCRKTKNRCRMVMWCKLRDRNAPVEDDAVEVYDHLVL